MDPPRNAGIKIREPHKSEVLELPGVQPMGWSHKIDTAANASRRAKEKAEL